MFWETVFGWPIQNLRLRRLEFQSFKLSFLTAIRINNFATFFSKINFVVKFNYN